MGQFLFAHFIQVLIHPRSFFFILLSVLLWLLVLPVRTLNIAGTFLLQYGSWRTILYDNVRYWYLKMFFKFRRMLLIDDTGSYVLSIDAENLVKRMVFANHQLNQDIQKRHDENINEIFLNLEIFIANVFEWNGPYGVLF